MSIIAISSLKRNKQIIGANIFDTDTLKLHSLRDDDIVESLKSGKKIRNLEIKNGKINWAQGSVNRYASVNVECTPDVENANNITIAGYYTLKETGTKIYVAINYKGDIVLINDNNISKYTFSNCKIVNREGKSCIVSLSGELDNLDVASRAQYKVDGEDVYVMLPFYDLTRFELPKDLKILSHGDSKAIHNLYMEPKVMRDTIKHLVLNEDITFIKGLISSPMPNLETIEFRGGVERLYKEALKNAPNISYIRLNSMKGGVGNLEIMELRKLKKVYIKELPQSYKYTSFDGCDKLDPKSLLGEGVKLIGGGTFNNCNFIEHIELPKSMELINTSAFNGCTNIRSLRINSLIELESDSKESMLLRDSQKAIIYCPYDFPVNYLKRYTNKSVQIVKDKPTLNQSELAKKINNKALMASALGITLKIDDIVERIKDITNTISFISNDYWKDAIKANIKKDLATEIRIIGENRLFIRLNIGTLTPALGRKDNSVKFSGSGNYYYYKVINSPSDNRDYLYIVPVDKNTSIKIIQDKIDYGNERELAFRITLKTQEFVLKMPVLKDIIQLNLIKSIQEKEESIEVKLADGKIKNYNADSFRYF